MESFPRPTPTEEKQKPAEEKLETGKKVFKFLDRTKFLDIRKSDEQFNRWFQKLSYENYLSYLTRLNGILRKAPIKNRLADGNKVEITFGIAKNISYLPPTAEQKERLMRESFNALKQIPDNEDRALLAYYSLQAIHPYSDGNGRTGRLIHEIISDEGKELTEEKLSELLDHEKEGHSGTGKGRDTFAEKVLDPGKAYYLINREVAKQVLREEFIHENGRIYIAFCSGVGNLSEAVKQKLSPKEAILAEKILDEGDVNNFPFNGIVLSKFLSKRPDLQKYQYQLNQPLDERLGVIPEDFGKKIAGIHAEELISSLTEDDVHRLIEIHKEVKMRFIKTMINIFVHPENYKIKTRRGDDLFIKSIFRK